MTSVDQYNLTTVINKEEFKSYVYVEELEVEGRSLVAKKALYPGDVVLIEEPLTKYDLKPTCRSTKSPYFSKELWRSLMAIVREHEEPVEHFNDFKKQGKTDTEEDDNDSYSGYSSEEETDEEEEEEEAMADSDFCPGVPAAILAYLDIHPPTHVFSKIRPRKTFKSDDFDFFYYPDPQEDPQWAEHKTYQLVCDVVHRVVKTEPLYSHVDASDLINFVLKIYCNAHTVALPRAREIPTHSHKKYRREIYKPKFAENDTYWGEDEEELVITPTITLLRWGSKMPHSCTPNLFLRFEPASNAMVFTVIRPLEAGEPLSFSYLPEDDLSVGGLICGTAEDRRKKLEKFKFFTCTCESCIDWDWARGVLCKKCNTSENYCNRQGIWKCFNCQNLNEPTFIGDREKSVTRVLMGFASRIYNNRINQSVLGMLEPYLFDLLKPADENQVPVPRNHWTFGIVHSLLATYHLYLFPKAFGKGLADRLGLFEMGLKEALTYVELFNGCIVHHNNSESMSHGNPLAAFFAGWRILHIVIDLVMDTTENKYANATYERSDSESDSDSDSDSTGEEEATIIKPKQEVKPVTEEETTPAEPELIPLPQEWIEPITKISNIVTEEWMPLIEQVFKNHQSPVVDDMRRQIKDFAERVEQTSKVTTQN
ncbi:hypothetical protein EDC94DRAFT_618977 [Helicostylum pulchrum]|uniref:SET domain-containing protein n=1 Tax=Helicostylum pulchrum TaxID=562976 RepID=A0ABP9XWM4_9FUNG|nr:hypothetical protein EDC94DRAFT_618977 [Helicostylum pulchrum]